MLYTMNTLEYIHTVYKILCKAVPLDSSGAGFHFLRQSINLNPCYNDEIRG